MRTQKFEVKQEHIDLLRRANVDWNDAEFGAPAIDPKRPYGNSSVYDDINKILEFPFTKSEETEDYSPKAYAEMRKLHKETATALQIFLVTGEMQTGVYVADEYSIEWRKL